MNDGSQWSEVRMDQTNRKRGSGRTLKVGGLDLMGGYLGGVMVV